MYENVNISSGTAHFPGIEFNNKQSQMISETTNWQENVFIWEVEGKIASRNVWKNVQNSRQNVFVRQRIPRHLAVKPQDFLRPLIFLAVHRYSGYGDDGQNGRDGRLMPCLACVKPGSLRSAFQKMNWKRQEQPQKPFPFTATRKSSVKHRLHP